MAPLPRIPTTGLTAAAIATVTAGLTAAAGTSASAPPVHLAYATPVAALAGSGRCAPAWRAVPAPDPGLANVLFGAGAASGRDVWAVGSQTKDGRTLITLADHFDGTRWRVVPSPNTVRGENDLFGVAALAANDVWAVGRTGTPFVTRTRPLIEHYNGTSWKIVKAPQLAGDTDLSAVLGFAANDVWAAGISTPPGSPRHALMLHWNGSRWSVAHLPPDPGVNNYLFALGASGPRDLWTVGANFHGAGEPTTIHWDGHAWTRVPATTSIPSAAFYSVAATARSDAWAGGTGGVYQNDKAIMAHWTGTVWSYARFPQLGKGFGNKGQGPVNQVDGLAGSSPGDVWAAGEYMSWPKPYHHGPLTEFMAHWDGTSWQAWPGRANRLSHQVIALANGPVWSVGEQDSRGGFHSAIDRVCPVAVNGQVFTPEHSSLALGEIAAWKIVNTKAPVSIRDTTGLIRSGFIDPGGSFTYGFNASGTYRIRASEGGGSTATSPAAAPATIAVSPEIHQAGPARATVSWALSAAVPQFLFDVQIRRPGTARFVAWKTGTRLTTATFTADRGAGTYAFRARVRRVDGAGATGYSPPVTIHLR
jgi:hypothetical protein